MAAKLFNSLDTTSRIIPSTLPVAVRLNNSNQNFLLLDHCATRMLRFTSETHSWTYSLLTIGTSIKYVSTFLAFFETLLPMSLLFYTTRWGCPNTSLEASPRITERCQVGQVFSLGLQWYLYLIKWQEIFQQGLRGSDHKALQISMWKVCCWSSAAWVKTDSSLS